MMAKKSKNIPGDKDVYLAFKTVFTGPPNSEVRSPSAIKKLVHQSEKRPEVTQFFQRNNNNAMRGVVYDRLKVLLEQQVFNSYLHAKLKFPDLPSVTTAQTADRAASEAEAAIDHAQAIEEALHGDQEVVDDTTDDSDATCTNPSVLHPDDSSLAHAQDRLVAPLSSTGPSVPSLFPLRLPFITGHKIITEVQAVLEQACFDFAKHAMPEILASRGWECAEAVELNIWVYLFRQREQSPFQTSLSKQEEDDSFYKSLCNIRHTAVHRVHITAAQLKKYLRDGEFLATLLNDGPAVVRLAAMLCEVQRITTEMEDYKWMLACKLDQTRARIAAERADLDRQEKEAIDGMVQADKEYQLYAGTSLEQIFATREAEVTTARDDSVVDDGNEDTEESEEVPEANTVEDFDDFDLPLALGIPYNDE